MGVTGVWRGSPTSAFGVKVMPSAAEKRASPWGLSPLRGRVHGDAPAPGSRLPGSVPGPQPPGGPARGEEAAL